MSQSATCMEPHDCPYCLLLSGPASAPAPEGCAAHCCPVPSSEGGAHWHLRNAAMSTPAAAGSGFRYAHPLCAGRLWPPQAPHNDLGSSHCELQKPDYYSRVSPGLQAASTSYLTRLPRDNLMPLRTVSLPGSALRKHGGTLLLGSFVLESLVASNPKPKLSQVAHRKNMKIPFVFKQIGTFYYALR